MVPNSRKNFKFLADNKIEPVKVRKNASLHARRCMPRKISVRAERRS